MALAGLLPLPISTCILHRYFLTLPEGWFTFSTGVGSTACNNLGESCQPSSWHMPISLKQVQPEDLPLTRRVSITKRD